MITPAKRIAYLHEAERASIKDLRYHWQKRDDDRARIGRTSIAFSGLRDRYAWAVAYETGQIEEALATAQALRAARVALEAATGWINTTGVA